MLVMVLVGALLETHMGRDREVMDAVPYLVFLLGILGRWDSIPHS